MNCPWVKSQITLYVFEELGDADRVEVQQHLARCQDCARAAEAEKQLRRWMDLRPRGEPSAALLAQCRAEFSEALAAEPARPSRVWGLLAASFSGLRLQWQASLAVLLLSLGFALGSFWGAQRKPAALSRDDSPEFSEANISNIDSISAAPNGGLEITVDTTRRRVLAGSVDDPRIQRLLVYALRNYYNSGIRLESIEALKNRTSDDQIRAALVAALRSDRNPGVRLKALEALKGFEKDAQVKKALTDVLLTDGNPGIRIEAIDQLAGQRDSYTISILQRLAEGDPNTYIRMKSVSTLRELNAPVETY